jgi:hypothetical protein
MAQLRGKTFEKRLGPAKHYQLAMSAWLTPASRSNDDVKMILLVNCDVTWASLRTPKQVNRALHARPGTGRITGWAPEHIALQVHAMSAW